VSVERLVFLLFQKKADFLFQAGFFCSSLYCVVFQGDRQRKKVRVNRRMGLKYGGKARKFEGFILFFVLFTMWFSPVFDSYPQ